MAKAYVTCGLTFGDEGKGTITDALVRRHGARLVVRYSGGCQCAHNVVTDTGIHHTFAQYGSGSLAGAEILLTQHVLVDPLRLVNEGLALQRKLDRLSLPMPMVNIHEDALVITPFHAALNRIRENCQRHGSCGVGIGETARYALDHVHDPASVLRMRDLKDPDVTEAKLRTIRDNLRRQLGLWCDVFEREEACRDDILLFDNDYAIEAIAHRYQKAVYKTFNIIDTREMDYLIASRDTVWEGAQGVLLDEHVGFHPHTTWSTVTLHNAINTLARAGVSYNDVVKIGIMRAYGHRHGPGPFPSEDDTVRGLLWEPHNSTNEWQGAFRFGWLDMVMLQYALKVVGAPLDQLAITHADVLDMRVQWPVVTGYRGFTVPWSLPDKGDFATRERLTKDLMRITGPEDRAVTTVHRENLLSYIASELNTPIGIISRGTQYQHKSFLL